MTSAGSVQGSEREEPISPQATQWIEQETKALIEGAVQAINRTRAVFTLITVAGILLVAATFNGTIPWTRNTLARAERKHAFAAAERSVAKQDANPEALAKLQAADRAGAPFDPSLVPASAAADEAERTGALANAMRDIEWKELHVFSVPLLGFKIAITDAVVLGPLALAILCVWFYFSTRRENHVLDAVWRAAEGKSDRARWLHHGIAHHNVFTTTSKGDRSPSAGARSARGVLIWIPVWVPLLAVAADIGTVFIPRKEAIDVSRRLYDTLSQPEMGELMLRWLFASACAVFSWNRLAECQTLDRKSENLLVNLRKKAGEPDDSVVPG